MKFLNSLVLPAALAILAGPAHATSQLQEAAPGERRDSLKEAPRPAFEHVGFYTHGGWVFDYPFAPRAWERVDYANMFQLLKRMGYDAVQIWPLLEAIPMPLTAADRAELTAFRPILQDGRDAGLRTWMVLCANLTTPPSVASVPWRQRNPYPVMRTIRFDNAAETVEYRAHRTEMLKILNNADGYVTIDGDPGGYDNAQPQHFVDVFLNDRAAIEKFGTHPAQQSVIPWLWCGWGTSGVWSKPIEPFVRATLDLLPAQLPEPWSLLPGRSDRDGHANGRTNMRLIDEYNLESRSTLLFYEAIEFEPVPPSATLRFADIRRYFQEEAALHGKANGVMGNAQQPIMALPNIYLFARLARDISYAAKTNDAVLDNLAVLLGGPPELLRPAWKCLGLPLAGIPANLPAQLRAIEFTGEAAAFIPGGPALYRDILAAQVDSRRRMLAAMTMPTGTNAQAAAAIAEGADAIVDWWSRHHFVVGNNPGKPFSWDFAHPSQYRQWADWARANVADKEAVAPLAAQELVKRGSLAEPTATERVRQLLGI